MISKIHSRYHDRSALALILLYTSCLLTYHTVKGDGWNVLQLKSLVRPAMIADKDQIIDCFIHSFILPDKVLAEEITDKLSYALYPLNVLFIPQMQP